VRGRSQNISPYFWVAGGAKQISDSLRYRNLFSAPGISGLVFPCHGRV